METKTLIDGTEVPWETRTRNTNKGYILLTQEEIDAEDARNAQAALEAPRLKWEHDMLVLDGLIKPRMIEDVYHFMITGEKPPADELAKQEAIIAQRRAMRASKPPKVG